MKTLLTLLITTAFILAVPAAEAQKSSLKIGDGGTTIRLIKTGRATLVAGVVTVTDSAATATANIFVYRQTAAGTVGYTEVLTRTAGTSFTVTSKAADGTTTATGDTSVIGYLIIQP